MTGTVLFAQTPAAPEDSDLTAADTIDTISFKPAMGQGPVVIELFRKSTVINSIILLLSVLAILLFVYFLLTIKAQTMVPQRFVDEVNKMVRNREFNEVADYCRNNQHIFIATIIQRCVENTQKSHSVIMEMIDSEGRRRADIMWNRVSYLADVSNVAPMLGLLGTVMGMIQAFFFGLTEGSASISSALLSQAIGGAMATTMFGLIVGILAMVCHCVIKSRLTTALAESELVVHCVADHMKREEP